MCYRARTFILNTLQDSVYRCLKLSVLCKTVRRAIGVDYVDSRNRTLYKGREERVGGGKEKE